MVSSSLERPDYTARTARRVTIPPNRRKHPTTKSEGDMRLLLAALMLMMGTVSADAQWLDRKTPGIPRTPDGKPNLTAPAPRGPDGEPDLSGGWNGPNPEPEISPANAQPWVNDLGLQRHQDYWTARPS